MTDQQPPAPHRLPPPDPTGQPPIGVQLGLGPAWQPVPGGWRLAAIHSSTGDRVHVLIVDTPGGSAGIALADDDLRVLIDRCTEALSGLSVARQAPGLFVPS